jgi:U3 small nucleolar ribonucleoprotein protein IMP3
MIAPSSLSVVLLSAQLVLVVLEIQASVRFSVAETFLRAANYFSNLTFGVENLGTRATWSANSSITSRSSFGKVRVTLILNNYDTNSPKVDFTTYKGDNDHREAAVVRRYMIQKPTDYGKYNRMAGSLKQLAHRLAALPPDSAFRLKHEKLLLEKLWDMGILPSTAANAKLSEVEKSVTVSAFCRRRLPVVMTRLRMSETIQAATKLIEQGHVRVGTEPVTDTAFLVTRGMEG